MKRRRRGKFLTDLLLFLYGLSSSKPMLADLGGVRVAQDMEDNMIFFNCCGSNNCGAKPSHFKLLSTMARPYICFEQTQQESVRIFKSSKYVTTNVSSSGLDKHENHFIHRDHSNIHSTLKAALTRKCLTAKVNTPLSSWRERV